jgi:cytochrome P450
MLSDPDFIPFEPPAKLSLWAMRRSFIEAYPRAAYEQRVMHLKSVIAESLIICDPDLIHDVLVQQADAFGRNVMTRRAFEPVLGSTSLFLAEGAHWRWQRRAVTSTFRHDTLLSFVPVFAAMAERQVARWRGAPGEQPIDVAAGTTRTTFDIIVETMLGGEANLDAERYGRALTDVFETVPWLGILAFLSVPAWVPYPGRRRLLKARDYVHAEAGRIVAQRRSKPSGRSDLLDLLMATRDPESGRTMTDADLVTNVLTFISAGHETTAVALAWSLWLLAKDQPAQGRVCEEVRAVAGDATIEARHVAQLGFTRQVIEEAMRLYPPVAAVVRQAVTETTVGGYRVKPGVHINIPTFALHRHRQLWDNPNAFDPDRFAPDRVKARPRYAYLPFGAGPRVCVGASFAMIEAVVILTTLVRAFHFRTVPRHKPKPVARVTLRPEGGMPLFAEPR